MTSPFGDPSLSAGRLRATPRSPAPPVRLHLKPGQKGTKRLLEQYGDRLICVRYRYDAQQRKRFKTVELVVDEREWVPRPRVPGHTIVELRIPFADTRTRMVVKQAGGRWNPERKTWHLRYDRAVANGLSDRICRDAVSTTICQRGEHGAS
jgi:hypothetical protein